MNDQPTTTEKARILIVDDTRANVRLLAGLLHKHGYSVQFAFNGKRALASVAAKAPDLILLDINMPDMNGYTVCEQLKANPQTRDIPVLFISALSEVLDKVRAFSVGGVDYITKPFQVEEVLARVQAHLSLRRLQEKLTDQNKQLLTEINERKQMAQALREAKKAAEEANRAKSTFLANMSHELRTPLNAILGFAQVMRRSGGLAKEQVENLGIISRSGEHLLTLINNVLDLSKIEAGKTTLNAQIFDLYRLLDDLEDMFQLKAEYKKLNLLFERLDSLPRYVRTDEVKLRQVLINLLNNALKFTETGGVFVRVATNGATALSFEVSDTGAGIASGELDQLFEAFVQTETGKASQEGTGLGLPISRQFVRLMGGEIRVESELGRGSSFKFEVQVTIVEGLKERQATRRVIALAPNPSFGRRYRILIVDDKQTNRQLLIKLLNPLGFSLQEASNGKEALELWQTWEPDLIWMDIRMPVMDGYEATKRIKATDAGQATPIIALTASILEEEQALVLSAGCDDFLRKPFRETDFFEMMHKHINVRYIYDEAESEGSRVSQEEALTPHTLAALPPSLLASLFEAASGSDIELIEQVIEQIASHNPALAKQLQTLADDFEYDQILTLIEEANKLK